MKETSTNVSLQVTKNVQVARGKICAVRRILKCLPAKSLRLIPYQIEAVWGRAWSCKMMIPSESIPGHFDMRPRISRVPASSATKKQTTLLCLPPFSMQDEHTMLTSRAIKKQLCGPVCFHYVCLLPYRWQYRYVTTVFPAFRGMCFMPGVRFSFDCPLYVSFVLNVHHFAPLTKGPSEVGAPMQVPSLSS